MLSEGWAPTHRNERGHVRLGFAEIAQLRGAVAMGARERQAKAAGQLPLDLDPCSPAVARRSVDASDRIYRAARRCESDDRDRAVELYRRVLEVCPEHGRAHVNLGRLLHTRGEVEAAVGHYEAAVAAEPSSATAWFNLGVALEDLGRTTEAIEVYRDQVLRLDPADADAHYNTARLCEREGDQLGAVRHLRQYRRLSKV